MNFSGIDEPIATALDPVADTFESLNWIQTMRLDRCPNGTRMIVLSGGEVHWASCRRNACVYCGSGKSIRLVQALANATPSAFLTLTRVGENWSEAHRRVRALQLLLRRSKQAVQMAWVIEPGKSDLHLHALAHGDVPSERAVRQLAQQAGMGLQANVQPISNPTSAKSASGYLLKNAFNTRELHLAVNGGRLVHTTRRFWRINGQELTGMRQAISRAGIGNAPHLHRAARGARQVDVPSHRSLLPDLDGTSL